MKHPATHLGALLGFLLAGLPGATRSQSFTVTNHLDIPRVDEIVGIPMDEVRRFIPADSISYVQARESDQRTYLRSQAVDNNLDGETDELLFLVSIGPGETKTFILETTGDAATAVPGNNTPAAYSRFVPERQNDYAWENDRVAFRIYGLQDTAANARKPPGGGIDAFLKRVSYPIINRWYKNNAEREGAYHIDTGEGYDPYQVGASRGLGGTGIWEDDSLFVSSHFIRAKTIAEGPLRTIFELTYAPWDANGRTVMETKRISLDLGSHLFRVTERIRADKPVPNIVAGITLHDKQGEVNADSKAGWFRYWEPMDDSWLGTAIVMDPSRVSEFRDYRTEARDQSHLLVFTTPVHNEATFYAGFAWEKSGHFKTAEAWEHYLRDFSRRLASPLTAVFL